MPALKGSKTEENLKEAFAGESQANRRYLYFAQKADVEGYPTWPRSSARSRRRDRARVRPLRLPARGRRPGDRRGCRCHRGQPPLGHRGRDLRVHRDVPRLREDCPRGGLRRDRRWLETLARAEKSHAGRSPRASSRSADPATPGRARAGHSPPRVPGGTVPRHAGRPVPPGASAAARVRTPLLRPRSARERHVPTL